MSQILNPRYVTLCQPNLVYASTVSSDDPGDWQASFPVTSILDPTGDAQARSDGLEDVNVRGVFDRARKVRMVALHSHNLTSEARFRAFFYGDEEWTEELVGTGWIDVWKRVYPTASLNWEDPNYWTGKLLESERGRFTPLSWHFLAAPVIARSWRIEVEDAENPDGYVEVRAFIADAWQPVINRSWNSASNLEVTTGIQQNSKGRRFYDVSTPLRTVSFDYRYLKADERIYLDAMKRDLGIHGELFIAPNLLEGVAAFQSTFLATLSQLNPINDPYADNFTTRLDLVEKIFL